MPSEANKKTAIGITVYNRPFMVENFARSIRNLRGIEHCHVVVLDDASSEFSLDYLLPLFPAGATFITNKTHSGRADFAINQLCRELVKLPCDLIVLADSDLIFDPEALLLATRYITDTDGVLSLFNADSHPGSAPAGEWDSALLTKKTVGSAGLVWRRELLAKIIESVPVSRQWDWDFSAYLAAAGRRIFTLRKSAVQHLGFSAGQNSVRMGGDYGRGFPSFDEHATAAMFETLISGLKETFLAFERRAASLEERLAKQEAVTAATPRAVEPTIVAPAEKAGRSVKKQAGVVSAKEPPKRPRGQRSVGNRTGQKRKRI